MSRKVFTPEFKETAVRLASVDGAVVEDVARELGVANWTLRRWMKERIGTSRKNALPAKPSAPALASTDELDLRDR